jgi:hypothetical protein
VALGNVDGMAVEVRRYRIDPSGDTTIDLCYEDSSWHWVCDEMPYFGGQLHLSVATRLVSGMMHFQGRPSRRKRVFHAHIMVLAIPSAWAFVHI